MPIILIGNLTVGGTGKTPFVEYLSMLLKDQYRVAVLSRGYKRKSKGFVIGGQTSTWKDIGDEPLQMTIKFPDVVIAVDRSRTHGIQELSKLPDPPECIILDDGFQHRRVNPGLSILLTEFSHPYSDDLLLPTGRLREHRHNSKRADVIVITKSPPVKSPLVDKILIKKLKPLNRQLVFFSYIDYGDLIPISATARNRPPCNDPNTIIMVTGIANPIPLQQHLQTRCNNLISIVFPDHHIYMIKDVQKILRVFNDQFTRNKVIVTTEKDMYRFRNDTIFDPLLTEPLFYIPISVKLHSSYKGWDFNKVIKHYVKENNKDFILDTTTL